MFDSYLFNNTRTFTIADIHGNFEEAYLFKILEMF